MALINFLIFYEGNTYYTNNVTGQSQESEGSYKPARIKEVGTFQTIFVSGFAVYTHSYSFNTDICLHIQSAECTVRLLNQAGRNNYPYNPKYVGSTRIIVFYCKESFTYYIYNVRVAVSKILVISEVTRTQRD